MLSQAREPPGLWGRNGPPRRRPRMQNRRILFIGIVLCLFSAPLLRPCIYGTCSLWNAFHCMNGRITDRRPDPRAYRLSAAGFVSKASKPYAVDATGKSGCRIPVPPRIELVGELVAPSTALGLRQLLQVTAPCHPQDGFSVVVGWSPGPHRVRQGPSRTGAWKDRGALDTPDSVP